MPHLDVMMPGEDGLTILRSLDRATSPAVIILSMIGQEVDRIVGLEMGADDVLINLSGAIARMHDRLSRHAEGRTTMLAAIAHDLGTPLSRLAFWAEQLPDEARANADLDEMRAMLGSVLRFARDESKPATDMRIDLGSLLDSLTEDMNIAEAHRGTVVLDNHPGGGPLRVTLLLDPG